VRTSYNQYHNPLVVFQIQVRSAIDEKRLGESSNRNLQSQLGRVDVTGNIQSPREMKGFSSTFLIVTIEARPALESNVLKRGPGDLPGTCSFISPSANTLLTTARKIDLVIDFVIDFVFSATTSLRMVFFS
jgi:hypothetical protein